MEATKRLEIMIGNSYKYQGEKITVQNVRINGDIATIETDKSDIPVQISSLDKELENFVPQKNELAKNPLVIETVSESTNMYSSLQEVMLDSIEKIKVDKHYIPQAKAINETVKQIIDMEKVKIQTIKLLK